MRKELLVFNEKKQIGKIFFNKVGQMNFCYVNEWLKFSEAFPLSIQLPLQKEIFSVDKTLPFFANLLPEGEVRRILARRFGISEGNDFALLAEIGGDCAGVLEIIPDDSPTKKIVDYREISEDELALMLSEMGAKTLIHSQDELRLSLAGAQDKLPVYFKENKLYKTIGMPTSHILKPNIPGFQESVTNEYFCMRLAKQLGLNVADVFIYSHRDQRLLLIKRYDRITVNNSLMRIHQEDFCQAMSILPNQKYEAEGGPSISACFNLLFQHSDNLGQDSKQLLNWTFFNYLIGNADAHGKNLSILISKDGVRLTPFYDLLSTAIYEQLTTKMAMKIGGEYRPKYLYKRHWQRFAGQIDIKYNYLIQQLQKLLVVLPAMIDSMREEIAAIGLDIETVDSIIQVIKERKKMVVDRLDLKIDKS